VVREVVREPREVRPPRALLPLREAPRRVDRLDVLLAAALRRLFAPLRPISE
jgi:hypothetical protein